ncbi:preprotein translocase subunit Sec61beta [Candidatus Geothermarchaeota archaeon ex4572_27]|nr:MAG: preprotein translocase subunit Sec61beta [Candidatus Geothermarchaeota archaeon ex4572_27]
MSARRRRRRREAPMPATMAGLLAFFEDSSAGVQIHPIHLMAVAIMLVAASLLLLFFPVI